MCYFQIIWSCDFDIVPLAFGEGERYSVSAGHGGVVGKEGVVPLRVGGLDVPGAEDLGGLGAVDATAVDGLAGGAEGSVGLLLKNLEGVGDGEDGNDGGDLAGEGEERADLVHGDERTHAVLDGYDGIFGDEFEGVLDGMEAGEAAFDKTLRACEAGLDAVFPPVGDVVFRKDGDDADAGHGFHEFFDGDAKDGLALQLQKLLGDSASHTGALAASCNNHKKLFHQRICFMQM